MKFRQSEKGKEWKRQYIQSGKAKEYQKKYDKLEKVKVHKKKYQQSEIVREHKKQYRQSKRYKEIRKQWNQSEKGKESRKRYQQSEKYKKYHKNNYEKRKKKLQFADSLLLSAPFGDTPFKLFLIDLENFYIRRKKDVGTLSSPAITSLVNEIYSDCIRPQLQAKEEYLVWWFGVDTTINRYIHEDLHNQWCKTPSTQDQLKAGGIASSADTRLTAIGAEYIAKYHTLLTKVYLGSGDLDCKIILNRAEKYGIKSAVISYNRNTTHRWYRDNIDEIIYLEDR
jgi:hypothetical protein